MAVIYLVTSQEIVENTPMGGNVDIDKYRPLINDVQVLILEPILGTALYDKILADFDASALAGDYLTMYNDYIVQVVWHSVFAEYLKVGSIWVKNGGVYKHLSDDSESVSQSEVGALAKAYQSKADSYIERLERFLCDKNIAEYDDSQPEDYDLDPKRNLRTIGGLYFGGNSQK
jgi:hypothetical protein